MQSWALEGGAARLRKEEAASDQARGPVLLQSGASGLCGVCCRSGS